MSKQHTQAAPRDQQDITRGDAELDKIRAEIQELRGAMRELALLVLPGHLREACECGRLASRTLTLVRAGASSTKTVRRCDKCANPAGWMVVGTVALDGHLRETVRIANGLLEQHAK